MKILAIKSSGDRTAIGLMLNDEINSFSMDHGRKDRPNWEMFLENVGHKKTFNLNEIDLFAFENNQNSYTATRITASYLKGISAALKKPLISIEDDSEDNLDIDELLIIARDKFLSAESNEDTFDPKNANPIYNNDIKFKKLDE
tara:strand:+ start:706 stop:1137 length:432 start_codon:yes stop_codon:yes gene_type:complete